MGESPRVCCQLAAHRRTPPTSNNTASAIAPAIGRAGTGVRSATIENWSAAALGLPGDQLGARECHRRRAGPDPAHARQGSLPRVRGRTPGPPRRASAGEGGAPDRELEPGINRFQVRVWQDGNPWIEPYGGGSR